MLLAMHVCNAVQRPHLAADSVRRCGSTGSAGSDGGVASAQAPIRAAADERSPAPVEPQGDLRVADGGVSPIALELPAVLRGVEYEGVHVSEVPLAGRVGGGTTPAQRYVHRLLAPHPQPRLPVAILFARFQWRVARMVGRQHGFQAEG